jgi:hypothetical protein
MRLADLAAHENPQLRDVAKQALQRLGQPVPKKDTPGE